MKAELTDEIILQVLKQELGSQYRMCDEMIGEIMDQYPCYACRPKHREADRQAHMKILDAVETIFDHYGIKFDDEVDDEG